METATKVTLDNVRWHTDTTAGEGVPTCMLHSYTKAALTALQAQEGSVDPVWVAGATGTAFRIWTHKDLCPSATSVFDWSILAPGLEAAGWHCQYWSRLCHEEAVAEERRRAAHDAIVRALREGKVPVSWDIGIPEWGVITGFDDERKEYAALSVMAKPAPLAYEKLGKREIGILSVTIIGGRNGRDRRESLAMSLAAAIRHAEQGEWTQRPDYQDGLPAYPLWAAALERLAETGGEQKMLGYYAGTYFAARHYARRYLGLALETLGDHAALRRAADSYATVEAELGRTWAILSRDGRRSSAELREAAAHVREAGEAEREAVAALKTFIAR